MKPKAHSVAKQRNVRSVPAAEFKSHCLSLLDEVADTGRAIVVTKRGRPVARVVPIEDNVRESLLGSVLEEHDLLAPIDDPWDALR